MKVARLCVVLLVAAILMPAAAQAAPGSPNLIVAPSTAQDQQVQDRYFYPNDCEVYEGSVSSAGWHRLLSFGTTTANVGTADLKIGNPKAHPDWFVWAPCHQHYHFESYARYELLDASGQVAGYGHKQAFCIIDGSVYDPLLARRTSPRYTDCNRDQGISVGWSDTYTAGLSGQWVQIDGVPAGSYTLRATVNYAGLLPESDYSDNTLDVPVTIP